MRTNLSFKTLLILTGTVLLAVTFTSFRLQSEEMSFDSIQHYRRFAYSEGPIVAISAVKSSEMEEELSLESWMSVPFLAEEEVALESWMSVPFLAEEEVVLESWMSASWN